MELVNINVDISEIEKYRDKISNAIELAHKLNISELMDVRSFISSEINSCANFQYSLNQLIERFSEKISDIEDEIYDKEQELSSLEDELQSLEDSLSDCDDDEYDDVQSEIDSINEQIGDARDGLDYCRQELSRFENNISSAKDLLSTVRSNKETFIENQETVESLIEDMDSIKYDALNKLENAEDLLFKSIDSVNNYLNTRVQNFNHRKLNLLSLDSYSTENVRGLSSAEISMIEKKLFSYGDVAKDTLNQIKKSHPDKYDKILKYLHAKGKYGLEGIYELKKLLKTNSLTDSMLSESVIAMTEKIYSSEVKEMAERFRGMKEIRLTSDQEDKIWKDSDYLVKLVKETTGKEKFWEGFQEFFIRLSKNGNQRQMERIWNFSNIARNTIKDQGIRQGGYHEWLMCENFGQFLYNTKWGRDGAVLAMLMTKLVEKTTDVYMEGALVWNKEKQCYEQVDVWTHKMESDQTWGSEGRPNSLIHNTIRNCIDKSQTAAELLVNLEQNIRTQFSNETYIKFKEALEESLLPDEKCSA